MCALKLRVLPMGLDVCALKPRVLHMGRDVCGVKPRVLPMARGSGDRTAHIYDPPSRVGFPLRGVKMRAVLAREIKNVPSAPVR